MEKEFIYEGDKNIKTFIVPDGVTKLGNCAFENCEHLEAIILPNGLTHIGAYVFDNCKHLKNIIIPDTVIFINVFAFLNCESLQSIQWHKKIYNIQCINGFCMELHKKAQFNNYSILKYSYFPGTDIFWLASKNDYYGYGTTLREAIQDVDFKLLQEKNVQKTINKVQRQGYATAMDYRIITGACETGINEFLTEHNLTWKDKKTIPEVLELTKGRYGHETFAKAMKQHFE